MTYLQRYLAGEHARVWAELQALGPALRVEPAWTDARAVAAETMRRVRRNVERIVSTLGAAGYAFGVYPDGTDGYSGAGPWTPPTGETLADREALEARRGPLPLSLAAFWEEVGSVDWVGMHASAPDYLDPLVIDSPGAVLAALDEWEEWESTEDEDGAPAAWEAVLAPDVFHKDNVSGGPAYAVALPDASADFLLLNEKHALHFVPYLRLSILRWGGFPGLDGRNERFDLVHDLTSGLEPF